MQADAWHTNSYGYELIAHAVLDVLKSHAQVQSYLKDKGSSF
jgi:lysophospholipase L1-like esterase